MEKYFDEHEPKWRDKLEAKWRDKLEAKLEGQTGGQTGTKLDDIGDAKEIIILMCGAFLLVVGIAGIVVFACLVHGTRTVSICLILCYFLNDAINKKQ